MQKKALATLAAITLLLAGHAVAAQPDTTGFYAGAGIGYGTNPNNVKEDSRIHFNSQNRTASVRGFAGYRVNDNLAVEAQVASLGKVRHNSGDALVNGFSVRGTLLGGVSALAIAPATESLELFARIGVAAVRLQAQEGNAKLSHTSVVPWLGAGIQYNITKNVFARADYQFLGKAKLEQYTQSNHTVGLSVGYRF